MDWLIKIYTKGLINYPLVYDKDHKSGDIILDLEIPDLPDIGLTEFVQCMPIEYKNKCAVKAYRNYYIGDKQKLLKYKRREIPEWLTIIQN